LARAGAEFGLDLVEGNAAGIEDHQEVIKHVSGLPNHVISILTDSGKRGLDGLLAELFGALVNAAIEEFSRVGDIRALPGTLLHAPFKIMKGERGHGAFLIISLWARGEGDAALAVARRPMPR
jgi:hypothetical protein